ncbi:MAG TPA: site-specific integrase [Pyrinomonadaceae bacterium]|jgi:integrase|nr:site-specific integrase [Pyrinomonadaceae bacterium]
MPYRRKRKRRDGSFVVSYYTDIRPREEGAPTGARIRKLLPGVTNMADAREAEKRVVEEMEGSDDSPLVTDFLLTTYILWARSNKACPEIDERFARAASGSAHFRGRTFREFTLIQAEGYKRELRAERNRHGSPRAAGDINARLNVISRAFRLAVDSGLARSNPFRLVSRLDYASKPFLVLDPEDEPKLWGALAAPPRYAQPLARLALLTGMREGELLALHKSKVDFGRGLMFVVNPKWRKDPRKTEGLPVCDAALKLLAELCARTEGLLFTTDDGGRVLLSTSSSLFRRRAALCGLKGMRFHDLRHTFGTRLGEAGASPYAVARLMGHASVETSMIYVHTEPEGLRAAAEMAAARRVGHPADTRRVGRRA